MLNSSVLKWCLNGYNKNCYKPTIRRKLPPSNYRTWCIHMLTQKSQTDWTFVARNCRHLLTFSIFCTLRTPRFGRPSCSPDIISSNFISSLPSLRSWNRSFTCRWTYSDKYAFASSPLQQQQLRSRSTIVLRIKTFNSWPTFSPYLYNS